MARIPPQFFIDAVDNKKRYYTVQVGDGSNTELVPFMTYIWVANYRARAALAAGEPITQVAMKWRATVGSYPDSMSCGLEGNGYCMDGSTPDGATFGYYTGQKSEILEALNSLASQVGVSGVDWIPYIAAAMMEENIRLEDRGQRMTDAFGWALPFPYLICRPIQLASNEYPALSAVSPHVCPGSEFWNETQNRGLEQHKAFRKGSYARLLTVVSIIGAGLVLPAIIGSSGSAAGGAAAGAGTTATVSGAELAALIEAGTVGAEGAFLEAAALSGASVTYNTATGALIGAILPGGGTLAFDPAMDAFAQFGVDPSQTVIAEASPMQTAEALPEAPPEAATQATAEDALMTDVAEAYEGLAAESSLQNTALAEVAGDVAPGTLANLIGEDAAATYLAEAAQIAGASVAAPWYQQAGQAIISKLVQTGQAKLVQELQAEFLGGGEPASAGAATSSGVRPNYSYTAPGELDLEGDGLQQTGIYGTLSKAAKPLTLGAGLGLLALFMLGGDDERN